MKNLLYLGNHLSGKGKTLTTIESLSIVLRQEGYTVYTASMKQNKMMRIFDMLYHVFKYRKWAHYVLIDTYSTQNFYYSFLVSMLSRVLNLRFVPILHGGDLPKRLRNNPRLSKSVFRKSYKNISPSLYLMESFKEFGYHNLLYIPNSIDIREYVFKNREYKELNLLWVRSFSKIYNPNLAIDILKRLTDNGVKATLCMVGPENDGSLEKAKEYAEIMDVDVKFTGKLSKPEWIELSKEYNFFINTTNFDNMPVSVIEAMALGLSVISTNVGGLPFLIQNEEDGLLVDPDKPELFVKAIIRLQENPEFAEYLTLNARKKVEQFDWEVVKRKWTDLLN